MDEVASDLSFFGLREQPFAPTADPAYFYATASHRECLYRLWQSIDARHGIAVVLGTYGTGKTTLLRKLVAGMAADPSHYCTAVIASPIPSWTSFALLESIVSQFGLRPPGHSFSGYIHALNAFLLEHRQKVCTLIIDDAQNLNKRGQLELLRLVQNLETRQHKLLNMVLFAQLEWEKVLHAAPNFGQRINLTYTLETMSFEEMRHCIAFRLAQARQDEAQAPEFDELALRVIHAYSEGCPRLIMTLCRNALLAAARMKTLRISHDIVLQSIEKAMLPDPIKNARVAAAVAEALHESPAGVLPPLGDAVASRSAREQMTRDQRAAQMLLNAARERQTRRQEMP